MVDAGRLLADLKRLRRGIEDDLRRHHAASEGRRKVQAEWQEARDTRRTADTFETFFSAALDQAAVHWILALVFLRFLEDNRLLDRPVISGPGERLEVAQLRMRDWFATRPEDSEAEYLLAVFAEVARLPGLGGLYDAGHNPLFRLPVSGDGAIALLDFFRARDPATGELAHDFSDPDWNTRFLGDLYQDLSEEARKRFALLQTPDFVEDWILSRTLDPAIREFGYAQVRMIDPTCGSGHFLLGGFSRVLEEWRRERPDMPPAAQAQKALDAVAGVDLNPFAVEIARFRLLLAALKAAGETRLAGAPDFRLSLATGDSLLHGRHFFRRELGGAEQGFRRVLRHHYAAEEMGAVEGILGRQYHAVVGNPPYITPKDAAMRDAYREIYASCHGSYALAAPFIERFFDLAGFAEGAIGAGYVGFIVADTFAKREFGARLVESILPNFDLTHVVDCSDAHIPGHGGTGVLIMFGRNRLPVQAVVRAVMRVRGEASAPANPADGPVWAAITSGLEAPNEMHEYVSVEDVPRAVLSRHPWSLAGGGTAALKAEIERSSSSRLAAMGAEIGRVASTGEDAAFQFERRKDAMRLGLSNIMSLTLGDQVREHRVQNTAYVVWPYDRNALVHPESQIEDITSYFWVFRTLLRRREMFGQSMHERGLGWYEFQEFYRSKLGGKYKIVFGEQATHNHFVLEVGSSICNRTAPVIKLAADARDEDYVGICGVLNSSTACFWLKQVCYPKGGTGLGRGISTEKWEFRVVMNGSNVVEAPIASEYPIELMQRIIGSAQKYSENMPSALIESVVPNQFLLSNACGAADAARARMIALQEELDWCCYRLYGLHEAPPEHPDPPPLRLGERAFEIVMARRMAAGELETAWFERHRSTPITDLPAHWPADYRTVVERRIALIESDPTIGLIERPEYKRRWSSQPWGEMERDALRAWLLDRLEAPRYWEAAEPQILSARALADAARHDADFLAVAELYAGRAGSDLDALVAELVAGESVPFLAALRYTETGLRKRADWEATWEKQRAEDAIDADVAARHGEFLRAAWSRMNRRGDGEAAEAYAARMEAGLGAEIVRKAADADLAAEAKRRKATEVGDVPVPPKYRTPDFQSGDYWRLRGGLDVPKERFVSFPHCARDADPSLPILWAGHDHLARARAIAAWYVERKDTDGWGPDRLKPILAGLLELVPWLRQWHNDLDPDTGLRMGDFFRDYVAEQARELGLTLDDLRAWTPPAPVRGRRGRRSAA